MHALKARPGTTSRKSPDRISESPANAGLAAFLLWKTLEGRLKGGKQVENGASVMDIRPRSDGDVGHFEMVWKDTGRDAYRFTAW